MQYSGSGLHVHSCRSVRYGWGATSPPPGLCDKMGEASAKRKLRSNSLGHGKRSSLQGLPENLKCAGRSSVGQPQSIRWGLPLPDQCTPFRLRLSSSWGCSAKENPESPPLGVHSGFLFSDKQPAPDHTLLPCIQKTSAHPIALKPRLLPWLLSCMPKDELEAMITPSSGQPGCYPTPSQTDSAGTP